MLSFAVINVVDMTSQKRNYRGWTSVEDEKLVEALLTMKNTSGYKADNSFKPGYVTYLETLLKVSLPDSGLLAKPHIESRIKTMKDDWQVVYDMLNSTSGFGYDKEKNCVTNDSPGVWDSYIENHPKARKWRNKKLPHYEELCVIFGKDRAQGKRSRDAFEMEQEVNTEEQEQQSDNDLDEAVEGSLDQRSNVSAQVEESPSVPSKKKKNMRHGKSLIESFNAAVALFGENLKESSTQLSEGIKLDVDIKNKTSMLTFELEKMESLTQAERFKAIRKMQSDPDSVTTFWNLKEKEREDWVRFVMSD
ncbi:Myb/SANT-like domain, harbinger transposase-derived nuclease domain protein [Tanacetum coccineum]